TVSRVRPISRYFVCRPELGPFASSSTQRSTRPVNHSHLALQHLIHKLDSAEPRQKRAAGPVWLAEFVDQVAELFEPYVDMGRVGCECDPSTKRWEISMYRGCPGVGGGRAEGEARPVASHFDLTRLETVFDELDDCRWSPFPAGTIGEEAETSGGERS